jgi:ABC-type lipoprotein export system ATPase subunit
MNIQLQNVTYTYAGKYQRVTAVDGVSYTFHDGTLYTIMGASGSGKSTLLSLLAGLKLPTEGEITLDEQPIRLMDRSALRRDTVSVIYQDFNLFPLLTAEENVCYPLRLQKMDKEKALELARQRLTDMGIRESYFRKLPNQLSGGEQQRVAIARALAAGSRVILADEPTGSLDSDNGRMIVETLQRLARHRGDPRSQGGRGRRYPAAYAGRKAQRGRSIKPNPLYPIGYRGFGQLAACGRQTLRGFWEKPSVQDSPNSRVRSRSSRVRSSAMGSAPQ